MRWIVNLANVVVCIALGVAVFVVSYQLVAVPAPHFVGLSTDSGCAAFVQVKRIGWRCAALEPVTRDPVPSLMAALVGVAAVAWLRRGPARVSGRTLGLAAALVLTVTLMLQLGPVLKGEALLHLPTLGTSLLLLSIVGAYLVRKWSPRT